MRKYLEEIKDFYLKNRLWIIGGLFFIMLMQICSQGGKVEQHTVQDNARQELAEDTDIPLDSLVSVNDETTNTRPVVNSDYLFVLLGLGLLLVVAFRKRWLNQLMPSIIWITLKIKRQKQAKNRLARISVVNKTKNSITIQAPVLVFGGLFTKSRKFRLKGGGDSVFPLTLTPATSHRITIDIDQFRQKAGIDKGFRWAKVELYSDQQKKYSSWWKLLG